jgi:hypothetical protein
MRLLRASLVSLRRGGPGLHLGDTKDPPARSWLIGAGNRLGKRGPESKKAAVERREAGASIARRATPKGVDDW